MKSGRLLCWVGFCVIVSIQTGKRATEDVERHYLLDEKSTRANSVSMGGTLSGTLSSEVTYVSTIGVSSTASLSAGS